MVGCIVLPVRFLLQQIENQLMHHKNIKTSVFALRHYFFVKLDFVFSFKFFWVKVSFKLSLVIDFCIAEATEAKFQLTLNIKTACTFRPVRNCRIQVEFVTSLLTSLRQWSGLMHFSKSILASDILRPRKADYFGSVDYSQSAHVAKVLQAL